MDSIAINFDDDGTSFYCRSHSNSTVSLSEKLAWSYKGEECLVTPSGMAAITTILESSVKSFKDKENINIICCSEVYCDVPRVCKNLCEKNKDITYHTIDITKTNEVIDLFESLKDQHNIFFIESCTNPNGGILDYSIVPQLKDLSKEFIFIVDNTWLSHVVFNPFTIDANFVVLSLTKYYSGGKCIAGAIISNKKYGEIMENCIQWTKYCGYHVSPYNAQIICDQYPSMEERLLKSFHNTLLTIDYIRPKIKNLKYPLCDDHISHSFAKQYFNENTGPSVFTFCIPVKDRKVRKILKKVITKKVKMITSYGHNCTTMDPYYRGTKIDDIHHTRFRLSIGHDDNIENIKEIINEFLSLF